MKAKHDKLKRCTLREKNNDLYNISDNEKILKERILRLLVKEERFHWQTSSHPQKCMHENKELKENDCQPKIQSPIKPSFRSDSKIKICKN